MKRAFDLCASCGGLLLLSPLFAFVALAIRLTSRGPIFYRGERVGKGGKPFRIFKFRTMVANAAQVGGGLTHRDDPRITAVGRILRNTKIDELPQLLNVVRGEMSLVGPRPEDPRYVALYTPEQRQVLSVRPGITSIASIRFRREEALLPPEEWEQAYTERILPAKLDLELNYLSRRSFPQDLLILAGTLFALVRDEVPYEAWSAAVERLELFVARFLSWAIVDAGLVLAAYYLAILVRSLDVRVNTLPAMESALLGVPGYIAANYVLGVYRRAWRYASGQEAIVLFAASMLATAGILAASLMLRERELPLGAIIIGGFFTFLLIAGARYRRRLFEGARDALQSFSWFASGEGARVLIIGAGEEGQLLAWQLQNRLQGQTYQVVGFVDVDRAKQGMLIHNVRVHGDRNLIPEIAQQLHVDLIVIAIPFHKIQEPRELLALCRSTQAQVKILPGLFSLLSQNGRTPTWVDVDEADLLQRQRYRVNEEACSALIAGQVVMVTGAAGSIGSELCRQIAAFGPGRLVAVDINESGLHDLQIELEARLNGFKLEVVLCDIVDEHGLRALFEAVRPQLLYHVAAYKHVPILEQQPRQGVRVNVYGTKLIHSLARLYGVQRFVFISSDKAVNPTNVLGLTKRLGELIVTAEPAGPMLSTAVRFGNVLGSRGSVIPTFEKQIDLGGPITITDPEMTRYFLSIGEAVSLVIQAAAITRGGDIYILDMGVPVKIMDLANRLIRIRGLRPGQDIPIEYIGCRPGEKLSEELVGAGEERIPTDHPSIFRIGQAPTLDARQLDQQIEALLATSANGATAEELKAELLGCVNMAQLSLGALSSRAVVAQHGINPGN